MNVPYNGVAANGWAVVVRNRSPSPIPMLRAQAICVR